VLDPTHWPDMPSAHRAFLEAAIPRAPRRWASRRARGRGLVHQPDLGRAFRPRPRRGLAPRSLRRGSARRARHRATARAAPGDVSRRSCGWAAALHLALWTGGGQPNGVRRVEQAAPGRVAALRSTLASHDRPSCWRAL